MGKHKLILKTVVPIFVIVASVVMIGMALSYAWPKSQPSNVKLTITAGSKNGLRHKIAQNFATLASSHGIQLEVVPTSGSNEALQKVEAGEIDLALTQGALNNGSFSNLKQGAVLHVEPLHLLVKTNLRKEHSDLVNLLKDHTINISTEGSGTHTFSQQLLDFIRIKPGVDCQITRLSYDELLSEEMTFDRLPDAIFSVSSLPSPVVGQLVERFDLQVVDLPFASAFRLDWIADSGSQKGVDRRRIVEATIPAFTYRVDPAVPQHDVKTLGAHLQLVANQKVDAHSMELIVDLIYGSQFANSMSPPVTFDLINSSSEFPLHEGVSEYVRHKSPIITENFVEVTEQVVAIVGAAFGAMLFLWQTLSYLRKKRKDRQFLECMGRIVSIENEALEYEYKDDMSIEDLVRIQKEIAGIKLGLIEQFQNGDIDGAESLSAFINHANDASEMLTRMILHERSTESATESEKQQP